MSEDEKDPTQPQPESAAEELERVRALILQRRNRFVAAALASIGAAGTGAACGSSVCLTIAMQLPIAGKDQPPSGGMGTTGAGSGGTQAAAGNGVDVAFGGSLLPRAGAGGNCVPASSAGAGASGQAASAGSSGSAGTAGMAPEICPPPPRVCLTAYAPPASETIDAGLPDPDEDV